MTHYLRRSLKILLCSIVIVLPLLTQATGYTPQPVVFDPNNNVLRNTGFGNAAPAEVVAGIINWTLSFLAIAALVLVIYAGFRWLFSGGVAEVVKTAKDILIGAFKPHTSFVIWKILVQGRKDKLTKNRFFGFARK